MTEKQKYSFVQSVKDLLRIWSLEMKIILSDHGVLLFCVFVPILYPLLYSYIYTTELTREVPVTVIDNSHSSLSREFIRRLDASQWVSVVGLSRDVPDARQSIKEQRSYGFLEIPSDFSDNIVNNRQAYIGFFGDMSGMLYYKGILVGATEVSLEMNKHIKIERAAVTTDEEFVRHGVAQEWVAVLRKAGVNTIEQLRSANPNKLLNDLGGLRKKMKLDIPAVQKETIEKWING